MAEDDKMNDGVPSEAQRAGGAEHTDGAEGSFHPSNAAESGVGADSADSPVAGAMPDSGKQGSVHMPAHEDSGSENPSMSAQTGSADADGKPAGTNDPAMDSSDNSGSSAASDGSHSSDVADDPLAEAMNTIADLQDQLARRKADLYNVQQEYSNYVKRSKQEAVTHRANGESKVLEELLPVLDDIQLAREHGDAEGTAGLIFDKLENTLKTNFHLERFGAAGDAFDPQIHEALMHQTSADVESEQIQMVIQPGYKADDRLIRAARVGVVSPE
ncbi:MAG: nucleotide exchange factor GrpE [Actinomycetaceae bacterium]|nr:nucleotide exchange factor GrpE [Actinomycetaceae bacterium]MDY6082601.1 nucleotide exchange factor GrpE [Actinomycetaceae bacterium]